MSAESAFVIARQQSELLCSTINGALSQFSPIEIIVLTLASLIVLSKLFEVLEKVREDGIKVIIFRMATKLPGVSGGVAKEQEKMRKDFMKKYHEYRKGKTLRHMPDKGMSEEQVIKKLAPYADDTWECCSKDANVSGAVYINDRKHWDFCNKVANMFTITNALHMDEWPYIVMMEAQIIRMVINMYKGDEKACGIVTSGGTESIMLACLAYREIGSSKGIKKPNIVMSNTAHAAFDKAGFYFGIEMRKIDLSKKDYRADFNAMKRNCDSNTVCIVASCPEYPYGSYDPLPQIAAFAKKKGMGCHADACLGSFVNCFAKDAGFKLPYECGFDIDGVTSISCDPHKYGFTPKGLSVCLFKDQEIRSKQFFATMRWNGGFYATLNMAGSRPGAVIAATYAVFLRIGKQGYIENSRAMLQAARDCRKAIQSQVPEVKLGSMDDSVIVSVLTRTELQNPINCIALAEVMKKEKKWHLNTIQNPGGLHIAFTLASCVHWKKFVEDLQHCIKLMRMKPELNTNSQTATYGMTAKIPDGAFLGEIAKIHSQVLIDTMGDEKM